MTSYRQSTTWNSATVSMVEASGWLFLSLQHINLTHQSGNDLRLATLSC